MHRAELTLQKASKLPLLGITSQPSPYVIIECEDNHYTSPIFKFSQNPQWMYNISLHAELITSFVNFYIYHNNTNGVDELLAFGRVEFGQLLTQTNSEYKLRLVNSQEEILDSYLYFQHFNSHPKDVYLPLDSRCCLKLKLIKALESQSELICSYGQQSFALLKQLSENTFNYSSKDDRITFLLRTNQAIDKEEMKTDLLVRNITENSFFTLRFYSSQRDIFLHLSVSVVLNGLIPQNYNVMTVILNDTSKNIAKKQNNYVIKLYGPLNECVMNKKEGKIYVQNYSFAIIDYFQEVDDVQGLEPYCSFKIFINSLSWDKETFKASQTFRYYDNYKNVETSFSFNFQLQRSIQSSKIVPKLLPCKNEYTEASNVLISSLKLSNCYLYEIIKTSTNKFVHVDKFNYVRAFNSFSLKENKAEYQMQTRMILPEGGKGTFYLMCLDYCFSDNEAPSFDNSIVFKIEINDLKDFNEGRIEFNNKFLSFAKKNSLVKICKKFNQMVHDSLCSLKTKYQMSGNIKKGSLKIINIKCLGSFGDSSVLIRIDGCQFKGNNQINNFILQRPYLIEVQQGNVQISVKLQNIQNFEKEEIKTEKTQLYTLHGKFEQFFGTPSKENTSLFEFKLSQAHKLQIIYCYAPQEKRTQVISHRQKQIKFFNANNFLRIKLISASVPLNSQIYTFSISRSSFTYTTMPYRTNNLKITFQSTQNITLRTCRQQEQDLIFFSAYSHDKENQLTIYNGFMRIRQIMGKGDYQLCLLYQKEEKKSQIILIFSITHSFPLDAPSAKIKLNHLELNQNKSLLRSIFKYYLLVKINSYHYEIVQCNQLQQMLKVGSNLIMRNKDKISFDLYISYKAISKQQFYSSEKQLIGRGQLFWEQVQENSWVVLDYIPKKQHQIKFSKNSLINLEQGLKFLLKYQVEPSNSESRQEALSLKKKQTEIDVLSGGLIKLTLECCRLAYRRGIIMQIDVLELGLLMTTQSNFRINQTFLIKANNMQFPLSCVLTIKEKQKYYKQTVKTIVKLRGHRYKINEEIPLNINIENEITFFGSIYIFSNCFTSKAQGKLTIEEISFRGTKIDKFEVAFLQDITSINENLEYHVRRQGHEIKSLNWSIETSDILNGLLICCESRSIKVKQKISCAQLNFQKYDDSLIFEKQILINGQSSILCLKATYCCIRQQSKEEDDLLYEIIGKTQKKDVRVKHDMKKLAFYKNNEISDTPPKSTGNQISITIPEDIALKTKNIEILLQNGEKVKVTPSVVNPQVFVYFTSKKIAVKSIKLNHPDLRDKVVQYLGENLGVQKFMVDQNSNYLCMVQNKEKKLLAMTTQNWIFKFKLHRLLTLAGKRLLYLKNTVRDEVLTKTLGLLIKHGDQHHLIFDIDQEGNLQNNKEIQVQFGYLKNNNLFELYLCIDNYFSRKYQKNLARLLQNWMELMPISYGTIDLAQLTSNNFIAVKLQPINSNSIHLEKSINELIVRENDILVLGGITFHKKKWGYFTITLQNTSGICLTEKNESTFLYYKLEIEDTMRTVVASQTTEARLILSQKDQRFTHNILSTFLLQREKETQFAFKLTAFLLTASYNCLFFQKRQDISDFLNEKGIKQMNIQVKASETNKLAENSFQINFTIQNRENLPEKVNLIQKAKQINKVDALSFRDISGIQFLEKILGCLQISHFYECLTQIHESFIYNEDPQSELFNFLVEYLIFDFDVMILTSLCQIIQMTFLKASFLIKQMQKNGNLLRMYTRFKQICKSSPKQIPKSIIKVESNVYASQLQQFRKEKNQEILVKIVSKQKYFLFSSQQIIMASLTKCNSIIINIMNIIIKKSSHIRSTFLKDIEEWIEIFGFCESGQEFQLFLLLLQNCRELQQLFQEKEAIKLIDVLLQRIYKLNVVFQFWQLLTSAELKFDYYAKIVLKYQKELSIQPVQTCRGIKLMLSTLINPKDQASIEKMLKLHEELIKTILKQISQSKQIILLTSHIDLLFFFYDYKLLEDKEKGMLISLIKEKISVLKDNSSKLILSGFYNKLHKSKEVKLMTKTQGKVQENLQKIGFKTKYLITSD